MTGSAAAAMTERGATDHRLREIAEAIPQLIWTADREGRITWRNRRWAEYSGLSLEALAQGAWRQVHDPATLEAVLARWQEAVAAGTPYDDTCRLRGADGTFRTFLCRAVPLRDAAGRVEQWFGTNTEIAELSENEARYRALVEVSPQAVWLADPDGQIVFCNQFWQDFTGQEPQDWRGEGWTAAIHPEDRARVLAAWHAALRKAASGGPGAYEVEVRFRRAADGSYHWFLARGRPERDAAGRVLRWTGVALDIDARRRAVDALRDSEARLRLALQAGRLGAWEYDVARRTTRWSSEAAAIHGMPPTDADVPAGVWVRQIHAEDYDRVRATFRAALSGCGDYVAEYRIRRPDGGTRWTFVQGRVVPDESGHAARVFGIVQDVTERRRAEEALRESEQRLRATYARAPVGITEADPEGRLLRVNDAFCAITGRARQDLIGQRIADLTHPDDVEPDATLYRRHFEGETGDYRLEKRYLDADGRAVWIALSSSVVRDAEGRPLYAIRVTQDITRRRETETALGEERRALETLNRLGRMLAAELDVERLVQAATDAARELSGAQFGAFFYNVANEAGESYTLYTLSGVDRSAFAAFPMPRNTAIFGPTFRGEGIVRSDDITKDPRYGRNAPYHGMPKGHLPVRSHLAVPVISRSGEVLGGLFLGHAATGVFTEMIERRVAGVAAQAAVAIDNARLFERAQAELAERRRAEAALRELNDTLEHRVAERTAALEETTRQLQHEAQVRQQTEAALHQAQKMEAVGQLTGGIAHDFNNLLTVVLGGLDTIARRLSAAPSAEDLARLRRAVDAATQGGQRAATLTQRLLAFSRRQTLEPRPVDANRLVAGMSELLRRTLGEAVEIETVLAGGLWLTLADPNQLESALLNLAVNARDAMKGGGKLTIETANAHLDEAYARQRGDGLRPGQYVAVAVTDTGEGMTPEVMAHAFEPFFTTKDVGHGTGLGLSQVYGFVKQSGGHVQIYSEPGQGTTVRIYLPRLLDAPAPEERAAEDDTSAMPAPAGTVLVVEDNDAVRAYSAETLRDLGWRVLEAADGRMALDILAREESVRLLFTDIGLPGGMTGRELADAAMRRRPGLRVLFTTGYTHNAVVHNGMLDPGVQMIAKPFTAGQLAAKLREMLDSR